MCFTSAYAANASAVQTLLGKDDIVVSDQLNHASIIDAVRVAGVRNKFAYAHSDMSDLESKLAAASELFAINIDDDEDNDDSVSRPGRRDTVGGK